MICMHINSYGHYLRIKNYLNSWNYWASKLIFITKFCSVRLLKYIFKRVLKYYFFHLLISVICFINLRGMSWNIVKLFPLSWNLKYECHYFTWYPKRPLTKFCIFPFLMYIRIRNTLFTEQNYIMITSETFF